MPVRNTPFAAGTPSWVDLATSDGEASKRFYGGLFGWTFTDLGEDFGNYINAYSDGHHVAGIAPNPSELGVPDRWNTYLESPDIQATVAKAAEAGATILAPPIAVGILGSMSVMLDPAGGIFGAWQSGTHLGFAKYNEPGSVTWNEFHSKNFQVSTEFYATVFGWGIDKMSDTDEFRYYLATVNGQAVAGLMDSAKFLPEFVPSHWAVYFSTDNADAAVAKVPRLGGTVLRAPEDTPLGRMAEIADATGATFKLHQALA